MSYQYKVSGVQVGGPQALEPIKNCLIILENTKLYHN